MENDVVCGFIEELDDCDESISPLMNRSGGKAVWLTDGVPDNECPQCKKQMLFMLQLYAPLDIEIAYHRVFYLLHCPFCNSFHVLRTQIGQGSNYDNDDYCQSIVDINECVVCGFPSTTTCNKCSTPYCSAVHCLYDFEAHKEVCGKKNIRRLGRGRDEAKKVKVASEYLIETEMESELVEPEDGVKKVMKNMSPTQEDWGLKDGEGITNEVDPVWVRFNTHIAKDPNQVLRYNRNGKPLWISSTGIPTNPPKCKRCGLDCIFEWQLLPQFIFATNLDLELDIDFGTLVIYSCPNSCGDGYVYEEVVVQNFD
ncbi:Programmed cell death protein 2 [Entamoeba marina]